MELSSSSIKKAFLVFQETEIPEKLFLFQETEISYISGSRNFEKLVIFLEVTFRARKIKKPTLKKLLIFQEMEKISCTPELLLILFAERDHFKHKREIDFYPCPQPFLLVESVLNLDFMNNCLFFFCSDWL